MILRRLLTFIICLNMVAPASAALIDVKETSSKFQKEFNKIKLSYSPANKDGNTSRGIASSDAELIAFNGKVLQEEAQAAYSSASESELVAFNGKITEENIEGVGKTEIVELLTFNGNVTEESLLEEFTNSRDAASFRDYDQVVCNVAEVPDGRVFHLTEKKKYYIQTAPDKVEILFNSVTKKSGKINFEYGAAAQKAVATLDKGYFAFALPDTKTGEIKKTLRKSDLKAFPKSCQIGNFMSFVGKDASSSLTAEFSNLESSCKLAGSGFKEAMFGQKASTREPSSEQKYCIGVIQCSKRVKGKTQTIKRNDPMVVYCKKQGDKCPGMTECINSPSVEGLDTGSVDIKMLFK